MYSLGLGTQARNINSLANISSLVYSSSSSSSNSVMVGLRSWLKIVKKKQILKNYLTMNEYIKNVSTMKYRFQILKLKIVVRKVTPVQYISYVVENNY